MTSATARIFIAIALFTFGSLLGGAAYLEWLLPGGLPFGNALTAVGLSSAAVAALGVSKPNSVLRWFSVVSILLSTTWLPLSIRLAGNLTLNFDEVYGPIWINLSLVTFVFALISMLWAIVKTSTNRNLEVDPTVRA